METSPLHMYLFMQIERAEKLLSKIHSNSDPEYLHKYRVALRRARSILKVYLKNDDALADMLKPLLKSTNLLREIDVFVMGVDEVKYPLLLADLKKYRTDLYLKHWSADTVRADINALARMFEELHRFECFVEETMLVAIGLERYKEALALKKKLSHKSSTKKIHKVRIRCKQARYALEFIEASGLKEVGKQITKCKEIMKHFGDIQDAANQLDLLKSFCRAHMSDECERLYAERKKAFQGLKRRL